MRLPCAEQASQDVSTAIDLTAVSNTKNEDKDPIIFDPTDQPIIAYTVFPKFAQAGAA